MLLRSADVVAGDAVVRTVRNRSAGGHGLRRPVVASAVGGMLDTVVDGVTGRLVPPRDPRALADAIGPILWQPNVGRDFGRAGRRRVCERYTWGRSPTTSPSSTAGWRPSDEAPLRRWPAWPATPRPPVAAVAVAARPGQQPQRLAERLRVRPVARRDPGEFDSRGDAFLRRPAQPRGQDVVAGAAGLLHRAGRADRRRLVVGHQAGAEAEIPSVSGEIPCQQAFLATEVQDRAEPADCLERRLADHRRAGQEAEDRGAGQRRVVAQRAGGEQFHHGIVALARPHDGAARQQGQGAVRVEQLLGDPRRVGFPTSSRRRRRRTACHGPPRRCAPPHRGSPAAPPRRPGRRIARRAGSTRAPIVVGGVVDQHDWARRRVQQAFYHYGQFRRAVPAGDDERGA